MHAQKQLTQQRAQQWHGAKPNALKASATNAAEPNMTATAILKQVIVNGKHSTCTALVEWV